jgi:hypothetical protein
VVSNSLDTNLISYWGLDKNTSDSEGSNTLTSNGAVPIPHFGRAYGFDGVDDYIQITNFPALTDKTVSVWIYPESSQSGTFTRIMQRSDNSNLGFRIMLTENTHIEWWDSIKGTASTRADNSFSPNQWIHVVGVTSADGNVYELYINGVKQSGTRTVGPVGAGTDLLDIGRTVGTGTNFFNGKIDEPMVFSRALTATDIKRLMMGMHPIS